MRFFVRPAGQILKASSGAQSVRVLHVGKYFPPHHGGIEVFLRDLVAAQRETGIEAFALVHGDAVADDPPWLRRVEVAFTFVFAPLAPGFPLALHRAIRDFQPDVLHLHVPNLSALWALAVPSAQPLPWVVHWHSDVVASKIRGTLAVAYRLYRPFEQALLEHATRVIATSPPYLAASEPLSRWREKCVVIPLGINLARISAPNYSRDSDPSDSARGRFRVLSVGRLTYYKGFETLIECVAKINEAELDIVGEGEERAHLERLIDALPAAARVRIRLRGALSDHDKTELLSACDLFCLPSRERTEAFGIAVLEAMAMGKPCLVSDLPGSGMPWLVRSSGAGLLAPIDDAEQWRAAILKLMSDPALASEMGRRAEVAVRQRFLMDGVAAEIARTYPRSYGREEGHGKGVLIVVPARNEEDSIGDVVSRLRASGWPNVLVVNDRSGDATASIASDAGATVLSPLLRLGAWGAMQTGIRHARRAGFDGVITMDADGQHDVAEIPSLMRARDHSNVVIGACPERGSRARRLAWAWFRRIAGFSLADLTSGFRYYDRKAIEILSGEEATLLDYQDIGVLLLLRKAGLRIVEVPVSMNARRAGKSRIFHSWFTVAAYMAETTLLCLARWRPRRLARYQR